MKKQCLKEVDYVFQLGFVLNQKEISVYQISFSDKFTVFFLFAAPTLIIALPPTFSHLTIPSPIMID